MNSNQFHIPTHVSVFSDELCRMWSVDPLLHLYVAVNLPGIDNLPHFQLSLICNLLYEAFFGGRDVRLRPPGDAKRDFIGQGRRAQTLCQDYKICFGLTTKAAETAKMQVIQNKSISFD